MKTVLFFRDKLEKLEFSGAESLGELDGIFVEILKTIDAGTNPRAEFDEKPMLRGWVENNRNLSAESSLDDNPSMTIFASRKKQACVHLAIIERMIAVRAFKW